MLYIMASKLFWILLRNPHQSQKPIQSYPKATISLNLKRRHLDTAQRAMVASRLANMQQGARTDITEISVMSQPEAAAMLNVSTDSVQFAKKVLDQGSEELISKIDRGEIDE
jgi:hypothetical protein